MGQPLVSIISVNYNELGVTCELLESIRDNNEYTNTEIIIVDNASKIDPKKHIEANFTNVKVINSPKNLGFAGGNNIGIRAAKGEYLLFINNDAVLQKDTIDNLLKTFETSKNVGIVSPLIYYFPENEEDERRIQYAGTTPVNNITGRNTTIGLGEIDKNQYQNIEPTAYIHGAAMMISRKALEKTGLMPELFFLYYEELDWSEMIRRANFEVYVNHKAKVFHKESYSIGSNSLLKTHYITRNRMLFMRRNHSTFNFLIFSVYYLGLAIPRQIIRHAIKGEWKHISAIKKAISWNFKNSGKEKIQYLKPTHFLDINK